MSAVPTGGTVPKMQPEPVDATMIADRLGVNADTVHTWRKRTKREGGGGPGMPDERWMFGGVPVWEWTEILVWAGRSGRLTDPDLRADFEHVVGEEARAERKGGMLTAEEAALLRDVSTPNPPSPARKRRSTKSTA